MLLLPVVAYLCGPSCHSGSWQASFYEGSESIEGYKPAISDWADGRHRQAERLTRSLLQLKPFLFSKHPTIVQ